MTSEEQRMAIAKVCGWSEDEPWLDGRRCFTYKDSKCGYELDDIPNYYNDLNAMHEAEKTLTGLQQSRYCEFLGDWATFEKGEYITFKTTTRSARKRAEAFLKTLNLWS